MSDDLCLHTIRLRNLLSGQLVLATALVAALLLGVPLFDTAPLAAQTPPNGNGVSKDRGFSIRPPWSPGRSFQITCGYGCGLHDNGAGGTQDHFALDFPMPRDETIYPVAPGRVIFAETAREGWSGYGNLVVVEHQNDYQTIYAHLNRILVAEGQLVDTSTPVGGAGNSGTGVVHLHFAMYRGAGIFPGINGSRGPAGGTAVVPEPFSACTMSGGGDCENLERLDTLRRDDLAPEVVANPNGNLEILACGRNNRRLYHRRRLASGGWTGWLDRDGVCASAPSAAVDSGGRLYVFVRGTNGELWYRRRDPSGAWTGWLSLGGFIFGRPAVALDSASSRLVVFARGADHALYYRVQSGLGFGGWGFLGGTLVDDPVAARRGDGRVDVFVRGIDYTLWKLPGNGNGTFTAHNYQSQSIKIEGRPALNLQSNGILEMVARTVSDQLWHRAPGPSGLLSNQSVSVATHSPAAAPNQDGRLQAFRRNRGSSALDSFYRDGFGIWRAAPSFGGHGTSDLEAVRAGNGRIFFFTWGIDDLFYREQTVASGSTSWSGWTPLLIPSR